MDNPAPQQQDSVNPSPGGPYVAIVDRGKFVVPRGATLPSLCVKCGRVPSQPWLKKTFSWHSRALLLLLFLGLWPYVIVALIVQKKIKLAVPLCDVCKASRKKRLRIGTVLLLTCIPIPGAIIYSANDVGMATLYAILLGVVMLVAGLMLTLFESPLQPTHIGKESAEFKGACPEFLAALPVGAPPRAFSAAQQS